MISFENLSKTYVSKGGVQTAALTGVSAAFPDCGLVFILGKSGSGKSTLLNLLGGIDRPTSGAISVDGTPLSDFKEGDLDAYRNAYVGFVFQEYNLLPEYTVGQNIALALELQSQRAGREEIDEVLRQVELTDRDGNPLFDRKIGELSGGQKQRVAIARALIKKPKMILADEPTGALDAATGEALYTLLKGLSKDRLILVVTHDRECAEKYGDRILTLADGEIVADTAPASAPAAEGEKAAFRRGRLPVRRALAMGAKGLKHKKLRLAISILLSAFMCFIFGFAFTAATADTLNTQLKLSYDHGETYVILENDSYYMATFPSGNVEKIDISHIMKPQYDALGEYFGEALLTYARPFGTNQAWDNLGERPENSQKTSWSDDPYLQMIYRNRDRAVEVTPELMEYFHIAPDPRLKDPSVCRLPETDSEIAISDAMVDLFMAAGYRDEAGNIFEIKAPEDMLGKEYGHLTICGIYTTPENRAEMAEKYDKTYDWSSEPETYKYVQGLHLMGVSFVKEGALERNEGPLYGDHPLVGSFGYVVKLSGDRMKDRAFFDRKDVTFTAPNAEGMECHYSLKIRSQYSVMVEDAAYTFTDDSFLTVAWWIGGIFAVVSALLFMSYLSVSIEFRKRELGILRALGASKKDVILICVFESLIMAALIFAISLAATLVWCAVLNAHYLAPFFIVGFIPILSLFLLCFGVAALATILPVYRLAKRSPADILK